MTTIDYRHKKHKQKCSEDESLETKLLLLTNMHCITQSYI